MENKPVRDGLRSGANAERMRALNAGAVLRHVHGVGAVTRSELASATGLGRSAIKGLVAELAGRRLLVEREGEPTGAAGRPSAVVLPHHGGFAALAVEIAVDSLAVATVGLGGHVHARVRTDRSPRRLSPERTVEDVAQLATPLLTRLDQLDVALVGVGASFYGLVSAADGVVRFAPNLPWRDVPLAALVAERLAATVPVLVGNDADLGALAEHRHVSGMDVDNLLFISGEVGVGGGVIVDGRPLRGASGCGGEVGHLCVNPVGRACGCGSRGCWETEIGAPALLRRAGRRAAPSRRRAVDHLLRDASDGAPDALEALRAAGRWLGIGLAGLVNVFNPQRVALGGLHARTYPYVRDVVLAELDHRALPPQRAAVEVVPTRLGEDCALLGAAELALGPLLTEPLAMTEALDREAA